MQVDIERRPGSKVAMTITLEPAVLQTQYEKLFQQHARRVIIPGFRPGKAPRKLMEERVDSQKLLSSAIDAVIEHTYREVLTDNKLIPLERAKIDDTNLAEDMTFTYKVEVSVRPEVKLGEYKGLEAHQHITAVTDEMVETEIERLLSQSATTVDIDDKGAQTGDYLTVDYTMALDEESYPEGEASGYPLILGTDSLFPELNQGLIGLKTGESATLTHEFPDDYSDADLAGKTATYTVTITQARRTLKPELNDDWVVEASDSSLQTVEELRERINQNLHSMAEQADQDQVRNELVRKVVNSAELELPDVEVEEEYNHLMEELNQIIARRHITMEKYAESLDTTAVDIRSERRVMARDMVRRSLVLAEIAHRENITVTDEEIDSNLALELLSHDRELSQSNLTREISRLRKEYEKSGHLYNIEGRLRYQKVVNFLVEHAKIIQETPSEEDKIASKGAV